MRTTLSAWIGALDSFLVGERLAGLNSWDLSPWVLRREGPCIRRLDHDRYGCVRVHQPSDGERGSSVLRRIDQSFSRRLEVLQSARATREAHWSKH